ncbi:Transcription factor bHLH94 [Acorus calamus]|uniref:Transcription factor bHLH94 n=1 Tax=Acorus calamus TaxID=4465 RepID=A0AAV9E679_ACOCL|nr:Transcription factor bHLH94 [Acorus calamus]
MSIDALVAPSNDLSYFMQDFYSCDNPLSPHWDGSGCPSVPFGGPTEPPPTAQSHERPSSGAQGRRKRRRRPRACKDAAEAETQRMTHIAVERNRRRQMNDHLAVLRSLMPGSYVQKGDQASIVGGAIDFVKGLEQHLQSLEAQKRALQASLTNNNGDSFDPPFGGFFTYPQYVWCHVPPERLASEEEPHHHREAAAVADIEATLIEGHANLRILVRRRPRQLVRLVVGLQNVGLTVLHVNVTTLAQVVLYSFSAKVEEGCNLTSVEDIATAVHHMLTVIEEDALSQNAQF